MHWSVKSYLTISVRIYKRVRSDLLCTVGCVGLCQSPQPQQQSTPRIWGNTACQGSPAPTTQLLQWQLQHKISCVKVILYLRFSHICQSSSEVALRKQSSSTAEKLHIDRAVVSPECCSCPPLRGVERQQQTITQGLTWKFMFIMLSSP